MNRSHSQPKSFAMTPTSIHRPIHHTLVIFAIALVAVTFAPKVLGQG